MKNRARRVIVVGGFEYPIEGLPTRAFSDAYQHSCGFYCLSSGDPGDPKIWFTSMKSLAEVLSDDNRALLKIIRDTRPESVSSLAVATGRKPGNLSRTLKTMSNYGIVEMRREKKQVRPIAKATAFQIVAA